ncbi:MAG: hypothetical protein QM753_17210 [Thermomicrobiales bacterium]
MTDAHSDTAFIHDDEIHAAPADTLGVLSLSSASGKQPEFDPATALIAAATAEDGSVEEIVLLRLLVLRRAHPDAIVRTHLERVEDGQVVLRAEVTLPTGASASAYATAGGGVASIERTEHRALGRALDALGEAVLVDVSRKGDETLAMASDPASTPEAPAHDAEPGTTVLPDLDDWEDADIYPDEPAAQSERRADEREIPPARFSPAPPRGRANASPVEAIEPEPDTTTGPQESRTTAPPPAVVDAVRRANLRRHTTGPQADRMPIESDAPTDIDATTAHPVQHPPRPANDDSADDAPLENYSWTAFWRVARPLGLDKVKVEQIIGGPITPLTPLQVREKLQAAGFDI